MAVRAEQVAGRAAATGRRRILAQPGLRDAQRELEHARPRMPLQQQRVAALVRAAISCAPRAPGGRSRAARRRRDVRFRAPRAHPCRQARRRMRRGQRRAPGTCDAHASPSAACAASMRTKRPGVGGRALCIGLSRTRVKKDSSSRSRRSACAAPRSAGARPRRAATSNHSVRSGWRPCCTQASSCASTAGSKPRPAPW